MSKDLQQFAPQAALVSCHSQVAGFDGAPGLLCLGGESLRTSGLQWSNVGGCGSSKIALVVSRVDSLSLFWGYCNPYLPIGLDCSSLLGLIYRILNKHHKKELQWSLQLQVMPKGNPLVWIRFIEDSLSVSSGSCTSAEVKLGTVASESGLPVPKRLHVENLPLKILGHYFNYFWGLNVGFRETLSKKNLNFGNPANPCGS